MAGPPPPPKGPLDAARPQFPTGHKWPIWHNEAGLLVSRFNRSVPVEIKGRHDDDCTEPRLLDDGDIWWAFFPRRGFAYGDLFGPLDLEDDDIERKIEPSGEGFALNREDAKYWWALEEMLTSFYQRLLESHQDFLFFPAITKPRLPSRYGFYHVHKTRAFAFRCARRSVDAFSQLIALCSFALSLWLTSPYKDNVFDSAFDSLATKQFRPFTDAMLEQLRNSAVCNIEPGFRPGCFLDAYSTNWAQGLDRFGHAGVPVWIVWGQEGRWNNRCASKYVKENLFPPRSEIEAAKSIRIDFVKVVLPYSRTYEANPGAVARHDTYSPPNLDFDLPQMEVDDPPQGTLQTPIAGIEPPLVERGSGQLTGETWATFRTRCERREKAARSILSHHEYAALEARSEVAKTELSRDAKVFIWVADTLSPGHFVRTRIREFGKAARVWLAATSARRVYWPFLHEFDVFDEKTEFRKVPEEASGSEGVDKVELFNFVAEATAGLDSLDPAQILLDHIRDCAPTILPADTFKVPSISLNDYLAERHGYSVSITGISYDDLHKPSTTLTLKPNDGKKLLEKLLFRSARAIPNSQDYFTSYADFNNTAVAVTASSKYSNLSPPWDLAPPCTIKSAPLPFKIIKARLSKNVSPTQFASWQTKEEQLYILRPKDVKLDQSRWFVATTDPTTVLFVCRKGWSSMLEIYTPQKDIIFYDLSQNSSRTIIIHSYHKGKDV